MRQRRRSRLRSCRAESCAGALDATSGVTHPHRRCGISAEGAAHSPATEALSLSAHPGTVTAVAADCAIDFRGGDCGVAAIGRCLTCGNAFCVTHQACDPHTDQAHDDQCSTCLTAARGQFPDRF